MSNFFIWYAVISFVIIVLFWIRDRIRIQNKQSDEHEDNWL